MFWAGVGFNSNLIVWQIGMKSYIIQAKWAPKAAKKKKEYEKKHTSSSAPTQCGAWNFIDFFPLGLDSSSARRFL